MKVVSIFLLFLAFPFTGNNVYAQQAINVPQGGTPVLIDGKFTAEEWQDARVMSIAESVRLYLKQHKGHVFIGVRVDRVTPSYVDLFLLTGDSQLYNLHASMQIGERLLTGNSWTDTEPSWRWGNNTDWIANEAKVDSDREPDVPLVERLFPYDGFEFQIRRSRFEGRQWRVRIVVQDFAGGLSNVIFPGDSQRTITSEWAILNLE